VGYHSHPFYTGQEVARPRNKQFFDWLAGLIDGDGYLYIRKINRLTSLIITFDLRDEKTAKMIKYHLGGHLQLINGSQAIRFLLYKREDIFLFINNLNGLIRTPNRIKQFKLVCWKYGVEYKDPINLEYNNAWFSGYFDAEGYISYNKVHGSMNIFITPATRPLRVKKIEIYYMI
jgi:hypothetical protein